ncbi:MAG TPA: MFS transporter [Gemmatimonadaceae bacterium]|nr:MFS transporter [Gemmatimonadaceae bacterium]
MPDADSPYAPLRIPNFRRYVAAVVSMTLATMIQGTIVGWQMYELTHDPLALGLIGLAEALPFMAMSLYAGHVTDLHDRRRVAIMALLVYCASAVALFLFPRLLGAHPRAMVDAIYVVIGVSGVARSFLQPARQALGAEVVPRELFTRSVTWRSGAWQLAAVVGPALGGALYAMGGLSAAYATDAVLTMAAIVLLVRVDRERPLVKVSGEPIFQRLVAGVRFVFTERVVLGALSLDMFSVLFGGAVALLPVFAADILHVGPSGLGLLRSAPAIGAVVMSAALTHARPFQRTGRVLLRCVALYGLAMIAFGLSTNFALAVVALIVSGAADMVSVFIRSTLLTTRTPPEMLGRVMSVNGIFVGSSNEIGAFESGVTADWFGAVPSVVLGGALTLVVVAVTAWRNPILRELRGLDPQAG